MIIRKIVFGFVVICLMSHLNLYGQNMVDQSATKKTKYLLYNLKAYSEKGILFGHQDDQAYGVGWKADNGLSDVKKTSGKYPAIHGWDLGKNLNDSMNLDSVNYDNMKRWIKDTYQRGGINTVSFHMENLMTGGGSWDKTSTVKDILPGGSKHAALNNQLDLMADFIKSCKNIPIIFRPWHEHNGDWFWWGKGNCTEEEYIQLFRYTVEYLRDVKKVHQLIYAFSPDRSRLKLNEGKKKNYLYGYPGDEYVDIIGLDDYGDVGRDREIAQEKSRENLITSLQLITEIAKEKNKVAALTETGLEGLDNENWFTEIILDPIKSTENIEIAWVLVWRNANTKHHYVPYIGHKSEKDFIKFEQDDFTFFESDLNQSIYMKPKKL